MYNCCRYPSPIGELLLASDGKHLTGLWLEGQKHYAYKHSDPILQPDLPVFRQTVQWLDRYFAGLHSVPFELPLLPCGTPFQQRVWNILSHIPDGQTVTYGQIARQLGCTGASQAVGSAVGRNPISIIIPCHRVLGASGQMTGYAGGLQRKVWLLRHEGILSPEEADRILSGLPL